MKTIILLLAVAMANAQSFEVATVKRCTIEPGSRGGGAPSPGRLNLGCVPLRDLIHTAFLNYGDGLGVNGPKIQGGPGWIDDSFYEINAKAEGNAPLAKMAGPMLQALLEDRFALKVHRETKELPVFVLTVRRAGSRCRGRRTKLHFIRHEPSASTACAGPAWTRSMRPVKDAKREPDDHRHWRTRNDGERNLQRDYQQHRGRPGNRQDWPHQPIRFHT